MSLFDIGEIGKDIATPFLPDDAKKSKKYSSKVEGKKLLRKEAAKEILDSIGGIPKPGESFDVLSNGQSNAGGFYEAIRNEWETIEHICIATWIINREYIEMLYNDVLSGKIKKLTFIISNRMSQLGKGHSPNFNLMKDLFTSRPEIQFRVVNSHAKTYTLTNGTDFITIDGSGNWSENPRLENYTITNSKTKFDFRKEWMEELCNEI